MMEDLAKAIFMQASYVLMSMSQGIACEDCSNEHYGLCLHERATYNYPVHTPIRTPRAQSNDSFGTNYDRIDWNR